MLATVALLLMMATSVSAVASSCAGDVRRDLLYGAADHYDTADWICCHNTHYAERRGLADELGLYDALEGEGATEERPVVFYDSVCPARRSSAEHLIAQRKRCVAQLRPGFLTVAESFA